MMKDACDRDQISLRDTLKKNNGRDDIQCDSWCKP